MIGASLPDNSGRDLLIGQGPSKSQLAMALADIFSLPPDAVGDADDPKGWHFIQTEAFVLMLPEWVPQRTALIYATGLLEYAIAAAFFWQRTQKMAAVAAITVLIVFFPANIYAALMRVPFSGNEWGAAYLLLRAPTQAFMIAWIYRFILKNRQAV